MIHTMLEEWSALANTPAYYILPVVGGLIVALSIVALVLIIQAFIIIYDAVSDALHDFFDEDEVD